MVSKRLKGFAINAGIAGGVVLLLVLANRKFDILGSVQRGLSGTGQSIGSGIGGGIKGLGEGITGAFVTTDPSKSIGAVFDPLINSLNQFGSSLGNLFNPANVTPNVIPATPGQAFGEKMQTQVSLFQEPVIAVRDKLGIFGTSAALGNQRNIPSVRGTPLPLKAIARKGETFVGVLNTSRGPRIIRGSAKLFTRLQSNLNEKSSLAQRASKPR